MRDTEKRNWAPVLSLLGAVVLLAADQATKRWALATLKPANAPMTIIDGLLEFFYVENRGMAFGLLQNKIWFVLPVTVVLSAVILILLFRYQSHSFLSYAAGALLLSGAVGDLLDRLF